MTSYKFICVLDRAMSTYVHSILKLMLVTVLEYTIFVSFNRSSQLDVIGRFSRNCNFDSVFRRNIYEYRFDYYGVCLFDSSFNCNDCCGSHFLSNVDGYIISPAIYGKSNNLSPVGIIFFVAVFGALFGIIGIIVAIPAYILVQTAYEFFGGKIKNKLEDMMDS